MKEARPTRRKVLVLAPSLKSVGGVQNYTKVLLDALADVLGKHHVRFVAVPEDANSQGAEPPSLRSSAKIRFGVSAVAAAISWSPDLVICAHIGVAPVGRLIQKLTRTPYWVILYGIEVWGDLSAAKQNSLKAAARLVAITRFTLDVTVSRHKLGRPSAAILPPTLSRYGFRSPQEIERPAESYPPTALTVGRIAASERYKGHEIMLEAWPLVLRHVPNAEYRIVGEGDDRERLESRTRELGIAASTRFMGSVSPEELALCYDRCSVFAMPARTELNGNVPRGEGFGIVFLEAMAFGKPVIGPKIGAPAEFIRSGEHGLLVDPSSRVEVANALVELFSNPARARRMGAAAKEWVDREFTFERFCDRLRETLAQ